MRSFLTSSRRRYALAFLVVAASLGVMGAKCQPTKPPPGGGGGGGATLTVTKNVVNDDGGFAVASDFTMAVTGGNPSPGSFPGAAGTSVTLDAGSYSVSETGPSGYTASLSADCSGTISNGETKTCTITNDDITPPFT